MRLLAIELSTRRASLALFESCRGRSESGPYNVLEESWEGHQGLFAVLPALLKRAETDINAIDLLAVGRGPGAFSGIRVALTAAQTFALPAEKKVFTVSSGEALARQILFERKPPRVAVIGDARRGTLWYGVFGPTGQETPWSLTTAVDLDRVIPGDALRVCPDWERIASLVNGDDSWIRENRYPTARGVGELVLERIARQAPSDPLEPLYMHPAV